MDSISNGISLVPPLQFACVGHGLYRGAYPKAEYRGFLERLRLHTIVSLTPEPIDQNTLGPSFADINVIHVPVAGSDQQKSKKKRGVPLSADLVKDVLSILDNPRSWPIYVHCMNGQQVTSLLIACHRIKQGWSLGSALSELSRFTDYDRKEIIFIEAFSQ